MASGRTVMRRKLSDGSAVRIARTPWLDYSIEFQNAGSKSYQSFETCRDIETAKDMLFRMIELQENRLKRERGEEK
jgi:hypothetical protein